MYVVNFYTINNTNRRINAVADNRAIITPRSLRPGSGSNVIFGTGDIMAPLQKRNALVFPYTPIIQMSGNAEYEEYTFTHAAYKYNAFSKSYISEIVLSADFTSQTVDEAKYTMACMHFFRSITKPYFGEQASANAGAPPPIVNFSYMGKYQYKNVPVIIKSYTYALQNDVDYVYIEDLETNVPTFINITITMDVNYNPRSLRKNFDLVKFRNGGFLEEGYI